MRAGKHRELVKVPGWNGTFDRVSSPVLPKQDHLDPNGDPFMPGGTRVASSSAAEAFRLLAMNVERLLSARSPWSLAVVSAWPGDGRSLTAELLARAVTELHAPVAILDADPFGTGIRTTLGLPRVTPAGVLANGDGGLWTQMPLSLLPLGVTPSTGQSAFLRQAVQVLEVARRCGVTVIADAPACTTTSLAYSLASAATATVYVARHRGRASDVHGEVRDQLELLGAQVIGAVFNEG